jgi:hypothetical protein
MADDLGLMWVLGGRDGRGVRVVLCVGGRVEDRDVERVRPRIGMS